MRNISLWLRVWCALAIFGSMLFILPRDAMAQSPSTHSNNFAVAATQPHIIFVNLLFKNNLGKMEVALESTTITKGKAKTYKEKPAFDREGKVNAIPNTIICTVLDKNGKLVKAILIENPLMRNYEYLTDRGVMETAMISKEAEYETIRMNLTPEFHSMRFQYVNELGEILDLNTINLLND